MQGAFYFGIAFWLFMSVAAVAGIGLGGLAWFVAQVLPRSFYPILGVGVLAICVGVGLVIAARAIDQHQSHARTDLLVGPRA